MTNQHPITPPPELVQQWWEQADQYQDDSKTYFDYVATESAQWGADQELEACCEWLDVTTVDLSTGLRAARRPKPLSLKEEAMQALCRFMAREGHDDCTEEEIEDDFNAIRRALEALDD